MSSKQLWSEQTLMAGCNGTLEGGIDHLSHLFIADVAVEGGTKTNR